MTAIPCVPAVSTLNEQFPCIFHCRETGPITCAAITNNPAVQVDFFAGPADISHQLVDYFVRLNSLGVHAPANQISLSGALKNRKRLCSYERKVSLHIVVAAESMDHSIDPLFSVIRFVLFPSIFICWTF